MKNFFAVIVFAGLSASLSAQSIERSVISATGGSWNDGASYYMDYTAGETVIATLSNASNFLTQGFQQPFTNQVVAIKETPDNTSQVLFYPNPATDLLNIYLINPPDGNYRIVMYDVIGQLLFDKDFEIAQNSDFSMSVDMRNFATGSYYIRILQQNKVLQMEKIIKVNQ